MSIMYKIIGPLLKGNIVQNPVAFKKGQNLLSVVVAVSAIITTFVPSLQPYLNEDVILKVVAAYSAINLYLTTASTDKVGL